MRAASPAVGAALAAAAILAAAMPQSASADLGCTPSPYQVYWNIGGAGFSNLSVSEYLIVNGNMTQVGNGCTNPGCKPWTQGLWPSITDSGEIVNGGVPQATDLKAHLAKLEADVVTWIPDPNWEGNAVFDFESWTPIWEENTSPDNWHGKRYQNLSTYLVKQAHPTWTQSQVAAAAKQAFETAALDFFVQTLETCKKLRPKAKWGYYGFPQGQYYPCVNQSSPTPQCGYRNPLTGWLYRAANDKIQSLFDASTGIFPSVYLPSHTNSPSFQNSNADYVAATTEEAVRLASKNGTVVDYVSVRPYAWAYYHDASGWQNPVLLGPDLESSIQQPLFNGADGVVFWGDPSAFNGHATSFPPYLKSTMGPDAKSFITDQCACTQKTCSGHGACTAPGSSAACRCFAGWSGPACSKQA